MKTGMRKKALSIISYLAPPPSLNTELRLSVQSQDPKMVLAQAGRQESPYCSLCYSFPALPWASQCRCCCPLFSDLSCRGDQPHHCQMLGALPLVAAESYLFIHPVYITSDCYKERLSGMVSLNVDGKKIYLPSSNWFEFSRLFSTLYVNPCFQFLNSTSESRKCGKKYFLGDSAWRDFELNSERENLISSYPRDSWNSNLGVQCKTWFTAHLYQ